MPRLNIFIVFKGERATTKQRSVCFSSSRHYCRYQLSFYITFFSAENVITLHNNDVKFIAWPHRTNVIANGNMSSKLLWIYWRYNFFHFHLIRNLISFWRIIIFLLFEEGEREREWYKNIKCAIKTTSFSWKKKYNERNVDYKSGAEKKKKSTFLMHKYLSNILMCVWRHLCRWLWIYILLFYFLRSGCARLCWKFPLSVRCEYCCCAACVLAKYHRLRKMGVAVHTAAPSWLSTISFFPFFHPSLYKFIPS